MKKKQPKDLAHYVAPPVKARTITHAGEEAEPVDLAHFASPSDEGTPTDMGGSVGAGGQSTTENQSNEGEGEGQGEGKGEGEGQGEGEGEGGGEGEMEMQAGEEEEQSQPQGTPPPNVPPHIMKGLHACVLTNTPAMLIGETGTGKTTIIKWLAQLYEKHLYRVNVNGQTGREDLVGKYVLINDSTVWQDGVLSRAMREGGWILLDEVNAAHPEVLFVLQALVERDSVNQTLTPLLLTEKDGEVITPHPDFRIFATCNPPHYAGLKSLNIALASRFAHFFIPPLGESELIELFQGRYPEVSGEKVQLAVSIMMHLHALYTKGEVSYATSARDVDTFLTLLPHTGVEDAMAPGFIDNFLYSEEREVALSCMNEVLSNMRGVSTLKDTLEKYQATLQGVELSDEIIEKAKTSKKEAKKLLEHIEGNITTLSSMSSTLQQLISTFSR